MSAVNSRGAVLALLADCKEHPREDGLRLILADWLEEHGDTLDQARAEVIRSQVEFERLPAEHPSRNEYGRRARWLQQKHGRDWLGPLLTWPSTWAAQRGLFALALTITSVRAKALAALASSEAWAWVEDVQITHANDDDIDRLAGSPLFDQLWGVGFRRSELGPAGAQALGRLEWLRRIVRLDLSQRTITDRGLRTLLQSPNLTCLRELELANAGLSPEAGGILGRSRCAPDLERLTLWGNGLGDVGVLGLRSQGTFTRLGTLDLRGNNLGDAAARAIAECSAFASLRSLNLADNHIGSSGALALAASPYLGELDSLILWGNPVEAHSGQALVERFGGRVHVSPVGS